ncbi:MAG: hypothetical protein C5B45_02815 [Chlamydiae bacterium]|nr:MAG: hypothetical protein C5B45_02815 [Chlamydiota bacterium]
MIELVKNVNRIIIMKINPINNKQTFIFKSLKTIQSLGWVAVAILALPTVIGSYFAWKKLVAIWSKKERSDTQKTDQVASKALHTEDDFEDFSIIGMTLNEDYVTKTPQEEKEALYEDAIKQFEGVDCLGSRSAEAYIDYLKNTEQNLDFHFDTSLLYGSGLNLQKFLTRITTKIEEAGLFSKKRGLVFVPFLLERNLFHEQHAVVAVIDMGKQQVEYFDPKGNLFYSIFGSLVDRNLPQNVPTQEFLEKLSGISFPGEKPSIIRNINGPQSLFNKVDCGAHVLDFVQTRMFTNFIPSGRYPNYFETSLSSNGKQLRQEMAATLQSRLDTGRINL